MGVRSAGLPKTSRIPALRSDRAKGRTRGVARAVGLARTRTRVIRAETTKVAESTSSEVRTPNSSTIAPPAANPMT